MAHLADRLSNSTASASPVDPAHVNRILVIKPCCLGDVMMATPCLRALRRHFPTAEIHVLTTEWCVPALAGNPNVDAIFRYPDHMTFVRLLRLARRLRDRGYDLGIGLDRSPYVHAAMVLAGIPLRAGIDNRGRGVGLTHRVNPKLGQHETEVYLATIATFGVPPAGLEPDFVISDKARAKAAAVLSDTGRSLVVIHPGGAVNPGVTMLTKRWPAISFGELASSLINDLGVEVVFVGGESDREAVQIAKDFTDAAVGDLSGQLSVAELAAVIERAELYIGNDSGMSHIASAVGTSTVTIFGPTSPSRYRPLGANAFVCAPEATRAGQSELVDLRRVNTLDPSMDIRLVSVDDVVATARRALTVSRGAEHR